MWKKGTRNILIHFRNGCTEMFDGQSSLRLKTMCLINKYNISRSPWPLKLIWPRIYLFEILRSAAWLGSVIMVFNVIGDLIALKWKNEPGYYMPRVFFLSNFLKKKNWTKYIQTNKRGKNKHPASVFNSMCAAAERFHLYKNMLAQNTVTCITIVNRKPNLIEMLCFIKYARHPKFSSV